MSRRRATLLSFFNWTRVVEVTFQATCLLVAAAGFVVAIYFARHPL